MKFPTLFAVIAGVLAAASPMRVHLGSFAPSDGVPAGWRVFSPRAEIAPRVYVDTSVRRTSGGALAVSGDSRVGVFGGPEFDVAGVTPGAWYRLTAYYRASGIAAENWQVFARVDWRGGAGKRAGQPDYAYQQVREGAWNRVSVESQAPAGASATVLQFYLSNAPGGTVWWDDVTFEQIAAPAPRKVSIASLNLKPSGTKSAAESVGQFLNLIEKSVPAKTDLIVLPEGITVVGTTKSYVEVAEPVPGPTTRRLGEVARARHAWIAAGIYEREGPAVYNTAVLLDRDGNLAGKYRKVYLPREEFERGLTPGSDYPVFRTDFGALGMMICYDVFYADPARALAFQGAEVIVLPIWGGDETLAKARAIEGRVFLVASGYDHPTYVMDPNGERIAQAPERGTVALATIDLNRHYTHPHLGDMKNRRPREVRADIPTPFPGGVGEHAFHQ